MNTTGLVIIFGSLLTIIIAIVYGATVGGPFGRFFLATGILAAIAWLAFAFYLVNAMNTDI